MAASLCISAFYSPLEHPTRVGCLARVKRRITVPVVSSQAGTGCLPDSTGARAYLSEALLAQALHFTRAHPIRGYLARLIGPLVAPQREGPIDTKISSSV